MASSMINFLYEVMGMYTAQPKKLLILQILDILRKYSDENHRLSQKEIADLLEKEYGTTVERKAIKRNLMDLIDYGHLIEYTEVKRSTSNRATGNQEDTSKLSDFYLVHDFSEGELRLLIDSVLSSRQLPYQQSQALIRKLEGLASRYFPPKSDISIPCQRAFPAASKSF